MNYASPEFLLLYAPTLLFFLAIPSFRFRFHLLLGASLVFYGWTGPLHLVVFAIVLFTAWLASRAAERFPKWRRLFVVSGIVVMAIHLFIWKYASELLSGLRAVIPSLSINWDPPLPLGISFFTFQGIAYLIDYRRGLAPALAFREFFLFKSFFPQLVMGPIVRAHQLIPQLQKLKSPSPRDVLFGCTLFCLGFLKKILVADACAPLVDQIYARPDQHGAGSLLMAAFVFTVQLWGDSSGYTDMGRGAARLLGITLPENILSPHLAASFTEFWRRWHVTFTEWLRDYLYIPLGGNRGSFLRQSLLVIFIFAFSGLWHNATAPKILFGLYHAFLILGHRAWKKSSYRNLSENLLGPVLYRSISVLITQAAVVFGLGIFRCHNLAQLTQFAHGLSQLSFGHLAPLSNNVLAAIAICALTHGLLYYDLETKSYPLLITLEKFWRRQQLTQFPLHASAALGMGWGFFLSLVYAATLFFRTSSQSLAFIYFQF